MTKRDEWIRVRSESELRAGMCVEIRPCRECEFRSRSVLMGRDDNPTICARSGLPKPFTVTSSCRCRGRNFCPCEAIMDGRLYRLSDSQLTEDETTRELERVR